MMQSNALSESQSAGEETDENIGLVSYMYLKPEFRQMNFSIQLLGQAISDLRKLGKEFIRIEAPKDSPAFRVCLKDGFEILSESAGLCLMQKTCLM